MHPRRARVSNDLKELTLCLLVSVFCLFALHGSSSSKFMDLRVVANLLFALLLSDEKYCLISAFQSPLSSSKSISVLLKLSKYAIIAFNSILALDSEPVESIRAAWLRGIYTNRLSHRKSSERAEEEAVARRRSSFFKDNNYGCYLSFNCSLDNILSYHVTGICSSDEGTEPQIEEVGSSNKFRCDIF
jgi:hypothetical protein